MNDNLILALNKLNELLKASSTRLSLTVCGAFALYLLGHHRIHRTARNMAIAMKTSTWISRRDITDKDYNDLVLLEPTTSEIEFAINHAETFNCPDKNLKKNYQEFLESIDEIRKLAK